MKFISLFEKNNIKSRIKITVTEVQKMEPEISSKQNRCKETKLWFVKLSGNFIEKYVKRLILWFWKAISKKKCNQNR